MKPELGEDEVAFPCFIEGEDLGDEPPVFLIVNKVTQAQRRESNPDYIPPLPPTERKKAEWRVRDAERELKYALKELEEARGALDALMEAR